MRLITACPSHAPHRILRDRPSLATRAQIRGLLARGPFADEQLRADWSDGCEDQGMSIPDEKRAELPSFPLGSLPESLSSAGS